MVTDDEPKDPLLTLSQVAQQLSVHPNTVRTWSNQHLLPTYRIGPGRHRRFRQSDVDNFIERGESTQS